MKAALFSSEHWDRVLAAAEASSHRDPEAERLWLEGWSAWQAENFPRAGELLRAAVLADPGLADGYLGLVAVSHEPDESLWQALAVTAERLQECQLRFDKPLKAYYFPLYFESVAIESADDCRLALARQLTSRPEAARVWIERCAGEDTRTLALESRLALEAGRFEDAVAGFQRVVALDDELRPDAQLGLGVALEGLGLFDGAVSAFAAARLESRHHHAERYASYRLAVAHEWAGQGEQSRRLLEEIYAEDATYLDVATRLGLGARPATADAWSALVAELESGRVNADPSISDNR